MSSRRPVFLYGALFPLLLLASVQPAGAQDFEITPFAGYRFGGDFFELISGQRLDVDGAPALGVIVDIPTSPGSQFEAMYTRQHAHVLVPNFPIGPPSRWPMTVEHYQAGGLHEFDRGGVRRFLTGALGLTRYGTTGDNEVRFSFAAGGGVKLLPAANIGLRLESRIFTTFVDASGQAIACGPGTCLIAFHADVLWQIEFTAGMVIRFR
jgi:hypothetical protein